MHLEIRDVLSENRCGDNGAVESCAAIKFREKQIDDPRGWHGHIPLMKSRVRETHSKQLT